LASATFESPDETPEKCHLARFHYSAGKGLSRYTSTTPPEHAGGLRTFFRPFGWANRSAPKTSRKIFELCPRKNE